MRQIQFWLGALIAPNSITGLRGMKRNGEGKRKKKGNGEKDGKGEGK